MGIANITPETEITASSGQTVFAWGSWVAFADADLEVYQNGTLLTLTTEYTVDRTAKEVTLVTGATTGDKVVIRRKRALARTTNFNEVGKLRTAALNDELDYIYAYLQQVEAERVKNVRAPSYELLDMVLPALATRANKLLGFDASGLPLMSDGGALGETLVSTEGEALVTAESYADMLTLLGLSAFFQTLIGAATATALRALLGLVIGTDIYSKSALDTLLAAKLALAGGTMTGDLVLAGNPDAALKAAPKQYVDAAAGTRSASGTNSSATKGAGDTTLITQSIAAGALGTTGTVRITVKGSFSAIASTPDIDLKLKFGSTTIGTVTFASATAGSFFIKAEISNNASASAQLGFIDFWHNASGTLTHRLAFGSATENSAGALNAIISADITGSGGDELTCTVDHYMVEVLP